MVHCSTVCGFYLDRGYCAISPCAVTRDPWKTQRREREVVTGCESSVFSLYSKDLYNGTMRPGTTSNLKPVSEETLPIKTLGKDTASVCLRRITGVGNELSG